MTIKKKKEEIAGDQLHFYNVQSCTCCVAFCHFWYHTLQNYSMCQGGMSRRPQARSTRMYRVCAIIFWSRLPAVLFSFLMIERNGSLRTRERLRAWPMWLGRGESKISHRSKASALRPGPRDNDNVSLAMHIIQQTAKWRLDHKNVNDSEQRFGRWCQFNNRWPVDGGKVDDQGKSNSADMWHHLQIQSTTFP